MALPFNQYLDILAGPGTWTLIKALFREREEEPGLDCVFTVTGQPGYGRRVGRLLQVQIDCVERQTGQHPFSVRGQISSQDPELSGKHFGALYNPDTRAGVFNITPA
ncbi:MAG TPA: hypothetical protein VIK37_00265 [Candidatus Saccharimonadales bacterium]